MHDLHETGAEPPVTHLTTANPADVIAFIKQAGAEGVKEATQSTRYSKHTVTCYSDISWIRASNRLQNALKPYCHVTGATGDPLMLTKGLTETQGNTNLEDRSILS
ncbi:Hypothetical predicted protein [Pelobates cultripes]|uniref:Uncharacterized protein n=1 Tax=Pelobates cultripes TaxID=61616 RepID=A0AAD1T113_PELCU|nr:Hypothetical predicted protein [Pelobates cultripes]